MDGPHFVWKYCSDPTYDFQVITWAYRQTGI